MKFRGWIIEHKEGALRFKDGSKVIDADWTKRPCGKCYKYFTPEGHDGCLGTLPGIMNACCGHGQTNEAYLQFWDGFCIRGEDALNVADILIKNKT